MSVPLILMSAAVVLLGVVVVLLRRDLRAVKLAWLGECRAVERARQLLVAEGVEYGGIEPMVERLLMREGEQAWISECAKDCRCCPCCRDHPCAGVTAGGVCDGFDCARGGYDPDQSGEDVPF